MLPALSLVRVSAGWSTSPKSVRSGKPRSSAWMIVWYAAARLPSRA